MTLKTVSPNNTLFIHKISRYISRCVILCLTRSTESQNAKGHAAMHNISQGKTLVICCGGSNHIISPRAFAFWAAWQQAEWFPLSSRDALSHTLDHVLVISPAWQVDFLCTDSSQAAIIRGEGDRPRDKPAKAKCKARINEAAWLMRCLCLRKA